MKVLIRTNVEIHQVPSEVFPWVSKDRFALRLQFDPGKDWILVTPLRETRAEALKDMDDFIAKYGA